MRRSSSSPASSAAPQILLATIGEDIPSPDEESPPLVAALSDRDVRSQNVPTSVVARGAGAATQAAARTAHGEEVVIKPAISAGARGTIHTTAASTAARAHLAALVAEGDALVQPYLPAVEDGEVSLVCFGGVLSHALRKLPADGDFRVQAFLGGSVEPHVATAAEREVAEAVLGAIPRPAAYARIDVATIAGEPLLMEAELIEPELFLPHDPAAAGRFADVLVDRLRAG